jgi:hypothetical protein
MHRICDWEARKGLRGSQDPRQAVEEPQLKAMSPNPAVTLGRGDTLREK